MNLFLSLSLLDFKHQRILILVHEAMFLLTNVWLSTNLGCSLKRLVGIHSHLHIPQLQYCSYFRCHASSYISHNCSAVLNSGAMLPAAPSREKKNSLQSSSIAVTWMPPAHFFALNFPTHLSFYSTTSPKTSPLLHFPPLVCHG